MRVILYMQIDTSSVLSPGGLITQGHYNSVLRESFDYRSPDQQKDPTVGERLYCSEVIDNLTRRWLPTKWVVKEVHRFTTDKPLGGVEGVTIAWCEEQPLSTEEFKASIKEIKVYGSSTLELQGGDDTDE